MSIQGIRTSLMDYISTADDDKLIALHTLLNIDNDENVSYQLSENQIQILEDRMLSYQKNPDRVITWEEMRGKIVNKHFDQ